MYPSYEQDKAHADVMDFQFKARVSKLVWLPLSFIFGFMFLPTMAAWDGGKSSLAADFNPIDSVGYLLLAMFTLCGILSTGMGWLFIRNWEYHNAPQGYNYRKVW